MPEASSACFKALDNMSPALSESFIPLAATQSSSEYFSAPTKGIIPIISNVVIPTCPQDHSQLAKSAVTSLISAAVPTPGNSPTIIAPIVPVIVTFSEKFPKIICSPASPTK